MWTKVLGAVYPIPDITASIKAGARIKKKQLILRFCFRHGIAQPLADSSISTRVANSFAVIEPSLASSQTLPFRLPRSALPRDCSTLNISPSHIANSSSHCFITVSSGVSGKNWSLSACFISFTCSEGSPSKLLTAVAKASTVRTNSTFSPLESPCLFF